MAEQGLDHVKVDAGPNPVRGRGMAQHVRPDGEPASSREPLEPALRGPVGHRRADRLMVEVDHDHLSPVLAGQPGPLMPVAGVSGEHRVAGRHGPRETGLRQRAVRVSPVPHVHMSPHHRAAQRACVRQQVHVRPAQPQRLTDPQAFSRVPKKNYQELVAGTAAARQHRLGLLICQRFRERRLHPRPQRPGTHRAELAGFPGIEPRRGEPQPPRLRQLLGHRHVDQPGPGAEPQELTHRGERGIDRGTRTQPPAPARGDLDEVLETGQRRQADRGPVHPLPSAPAQEARHPPGIGADRVRRTAGPVQRPQEIAGLPVDDETGIEYHPQLGTVKGRHCPLRLERQVNQIGHVTQRN